MNLELVKFGKFKVLYYAIGYGLKQFLFLKNYENFD